MPAEDAVPRFRFAPSPTGKPHVGSLHTALFSWALARALGGDFILRIDDTDPERSSDEATAEMLDALHWLGLDWDEGPEVGGPHAPYYQSQRRERHRALAERLVAADAAYYEAGSAGRAVRLRLPQSGATVVHDALRGPVTFENRLLRDPIIVRSDGTALYHLATVADDHDMGITHVVRGDDWLASAPVHVHLYAALGWEEPVWIHLPLIRNRDGEKLSKRDPEGGYLVEDFQEAGYLPQALFNYLLLLGWSPEDGDEIVDKWQVRRQFRLERLSTSPAIFSWDKLNWVNRHYLQRKSDRELAALVRPYLEDAYGQMPQGEAWLERLAAVIRDDVTRLSDAVAAAEWALAPELTPDATARAALASPAAHPVLVQLVAELAGVVLLDEETARAILQGLKQRLAAAHGWRAKEVYWPIRAALSGRVTGPPLAEMMALLGRESCLERAAVVLRS